MFDLENSIRVWRIKMLAAGIKFPVPLEELELHLREEIERQVKLGLGEQRAFEVSVRQIGQADALKMEFRKTSSPNTEWFFRLVLCGVILAVGWLLITAARAFWRDEMSWAWRLAGFADIAAVALSALGWRWLNRAFPVIPNKRWRIAIGIIFGCFGMMGMIVFMKFILPNFEFTGGQLKVVVLWGLTLMAGGGVVLAGLEEAARRRITMANS